MERINFEVADKVPTKKMPRMEFGIEIESMSGDADEEYTDEIICDAKDLNTYINVLIAGQGCETTSEVERALQEAGIDDAYVDTYMDYVGWDITTQDILRDLQTVRVFYYDRDSQKYNVKVNGNDLAVSRW